MKKLAIGCGIVLVVAAIAFGVGSWFVYHKVKTTIAGFAELGQIPQIEREVRNTAGFEAPTSGELSTDQLTRYLRVLEVERQTLGARFQELEARQKALMDRLNKQQQNALDLPEILTTYRDLAGLYIVGKRAQVQALNATGFSLDEYRWVQRQAYAAIGLPVMDYNVSKIVEDATAGRTPTGSGQMMSIPIGPTGPEKNKQLVEPHKKLLEDNAALSFFGL